ncbi:MAG: hypothetical protein JXB26_06155 [Candidatus Aminicenantes bacterium]|nr:hypothetical protein [Candidatus Aminicenantes bacterium]
MRHKNHMKFFAVLACIGILFLSLPVNAGAEKRDNGWSLKTFFSNTMKSLSAFTAILPPFLQKGFFYFPDSRNISKKILRNNKRYGDGLNTDRVGEGN